MVPYTVSTTRCELLVPGVQGTVQVVTSDGKKISIQMMMADDIGLPSMKA